MPLPGLRNQRTIREAYPSLALEVRNQRDMESFDQLLPGELEIATREGTGASSASAAVTRMLEEAEKALTHPR